MITRRNATRLASSWGYGVLRLGYRPGLLHDARISPSFWSPWWPLLGSRPRLIAVDSPGFCETEGGQFARGLVGPGSTGPSRGEGGMIQGPVILATVSFRTPYRERLS